MLKITGPSRPPLSRIMMRNRLWSGNWCCGLASLLWRLRRATAMETGLFEIQAEHLSGFRESRKLQPASRDVVYALFRSADQGRHGDEAASAPPANATELLPRFDPQTAEQAADPSHDLAQCFLRLANLPNYALDRLGRYEYTLWRQVGQVLFALDALDRRKPGERRGRFLVGGRSNRAGLWP